MNVDQVLSTLLMWTKDEKRLDLLSNDVFDLVVDQSQVVVDLSLKHTNRINNSQSAGWTESYFNHSCDLISKRNLTSAIKNQLLSTNGSLVPQKGTKQENKSVDSDSFILKREFY